LRTSGAKPARAGEGSTRWSCGSKHDTRRADISTSNHGSG
jgi:hypothetical protein